MPLLNEADALYVGDQPVIKVYAGDVQVWPSAGWSPADLAGLAIWLDASQLALANGAYVDTWPNLAVPALVGTNINPAPNRPVVRTNALNGLPVVTFATFNGLRWASTGIDLNWTVAYVGRATGAGIGRIVSSLYTPSNLLIGYWNGFENIAYVEGFLNPDARRAQTTNWNLFSATGEGVPGNATAWLYDDGAFQSGGQPGNANGGGWKGYFNLNGYAPGSEETFGCEVAEAVFYDRRLTDVERIQVEDYLRTKWGLP